MNVTMHPHQWFHHHHQSDDQARMDKWHEVLHHDVFWIVVVSLLVLVLSLALTWLMGGSPPSGSPYIGYYP